MRQQRSETPPTGSPPRSAGLRPALGDEFRCLAVLGSAFQPPGFITP
jgi:hypothetical protein